MHYSGGKSGAATISTDEDYSVLVGPLRKKPININIGISFDLDLIAAFKIRIKRVSLSFHMQYWRILTIV
jgi:hypothetical protein